MANSDHVSATTTTSVSLLLACEDPLEEIPWKSRLPFVRLVESEGCCDRRYKPPQITGQLNHMRYRKYERRSIPSGSWSSSDVTDLPRVSINLVQHKESSSHEDTGVLLIFDSFPRILAEQTEERLEKDVTSSIFADSDDDQQQQSKCCFVYDCDNVGSQIYIAVYGVRRTQSQISQIIERVHERSGRGELFESVLAFPLREIMVKSGNDLYTAAADTHVIPNCIRCLSRLDVQIVKCRLMESFRRYLDKQKDNHACLLEKSLNAENFKCSRCTITRSRRNSKDQESVLWICLICAHIGCGRYTSSHALSHFIETGHSLCLEMSGNRSIWDYRLDAMVNSVEEEEDDKNEHPHSADKLLSKILETNARKYDEIIAQAQIIACEETESIKKREEELITEISEMKKALKASKNEGRKLSQTIEKNNDAINQERELQKLYDVKTSDLKKSNQEKQTKSDKIKDKSKTIRERIQEKLEQL